MLPDIGAGVLRLPLIHVQIVFVCPQPLAANTHICHPDEFAGILPSVMVTELETVVCGLGNPFIKVPAGADHTYVSASVTRLVVTVPTLPAHPLTGDEVIAMPINGGA